ncbi:MAG: TIR domain-containing protein [Kiritimatiellia bacterium]
MAQKHIFIASSAEAIPYAKSFVAKCRNKKRIRYIKWWEHFRPARTLLDELERFKAELHGALIFVTPDCELKFRRGKKYSPNLNVLFEFGYFMGRFPKENVAVVKYADTYMPSDLDGYIPIHGGDSYKKRLQGQAPPPSARTISEFRRWMNNLK